MATRNVSPVFKTEEISLIDGRTIELKPVSLKKLRKINKLVRKLSATPESANEETVDEEALVEAQEEQFLDTLIEIVEVCVGEQARKDPDEDLEDVFDIESMYKVIEVCAGIKLNDENLARVAAEMAAAESR